MVRTGQTIVIAKGFLSLEFVKVTEFGTKVNNSFKLIIGHSSINNSLLFWR